MGSRSLHQSFWSNAAQPASSASPGVGSAGGCLKPTKLAPKSNWRAANLLKLPNTVHCRPGFHASAYSCGVIAALKVLADSIAVDVFSDVFRDVGDSGTRRAGWFTICSAKRIGLLHRSYSSEAIPHCCRIGGRCTVHRGDVLALR